MISWLTSYWPRTDRWHQTAYTALASSKSKHAINRELKAILITVVGGKFNAQSRWKPLDMNGFYQSGARIARALEPFLTKNTQCLEYGGGIGRISSHLTEKCARLTSVDINANMKMYGQIFCNDVFFKNLTDLPAQPMFDFCYSVAVFFHISPHKQEQALIYIHQRMKQGGQVLIDLKLGEKDVAATKSELFVNTTNRERFISTCKKYFSDIQIVPLLNTGVLMRK